MCLTLYSRYKSCPVKRCIARCCTNTIAITTATTGTRTTATARAYSISITCATSSAVTATRSAASTLICRCSIASSSRRTVRCWYIHRIINRHRSRHVLLSGLHFCLHNFLCKWLWEGYSTTAATATSSCFQIIRYGHINFKGIFRLFVFHY